MSKGMNRASYAQRYRTISLGGRNFDLPEGLNMRHEYLIAMMKDFMTPPDAYCHFASIPLGKQCDDINNSHKIGENYLRPIMSRGIVYCLVAQPWEIVLHTKDEGKGKPGYILPWEIERLRPHHVSPFQPGGGCTVQFDCHNHDSELFLSIDSTKAFNPSNPEHQYLLGLRALAGSVERLEGIMRWEQKYHNEASFVRDILKSLDASELVLSSELEKWVSIYVSDKTKSIVSSYTTASMAVGLAASDIMVINDDIVMVSVLPTSSRECYIVLTMRKKFFASRQQKALQYMLDRLAHQISHDPVEAIISLSTKTGTGHTFFSPADYDNLKIVNQEQKYRIERAAADVIKAHPVITKIKGITDNAVQSRDGNNFPVGGPPLAFA